MNFEDEVKQSLDEYITWIIGPDDDDDKLNGLRHEQRERAGLNKGEESGPNNPPAETAA